MTLRLVVYNFLMLELKNINFNFCYAQTLSFNFICRMPNFVAIIMPTLLKGWRSIRVIRGQSGSWEVIWSRTTHMISFSASGFFYIHHVYVLKCKVLRTAWGQSLDLKLAWTFLKIRCEVVFKDIYLIPFYLIDID